MENNELIDLSLYVDNFSKKEKINRQLWMLCRTLLIKPFSFPVFNGWRCSVYKMFGAKIGQNCTIYSSARIWAPWHLELGDNSCIGPEVDFYNQGHIVIGNHTIISQKSYLCASSHDYKKKDFPLVRKPIFIGNQVWVAADSFIGPGVTVGDGAIVSARSAVFDNVDSWTIVRGNPAYLIKERIIND